ncbi:MAG: helix-turn-helix domain-containing protein [Candidatus Bathyarchaeota archaeon]|nr:helix-turn-helix domain-containing protein [Candidatus Bathyarchaeota archaeon]
MEFPIELKDAIEALDNPVRMRIVEYLYDGHEATYTELLKMLGVRKGALTYHLKILTRAAVIYTLSRLDESFGDMHRAFYVMSPWGESVVDGLMSSFDLLLRPEEGGAAATPRVVVEARRG